jgi:hypothetical protein
VVQHAMQGAPRRLAYLEKRHVLLVA